MSSHDESETKPGGIGQKAKAAVRSAAERISERAAETTAQVKEAATEMADERREQVADEIGGVGAALHETAQSVENQDPNIAWLTEQASSRLQRAAEYVRTCSWPRLRDDSEQFARRHPVAFFGGMFAIGAAAGALLKAGLSSAAATADEPSESTLPPPSDDTLSPGTEETYAVPGQPYTSPATQSF